jgi:hypothetical protein
MVLLLLGVGTRVERIRRVKRVSNEGILDLCKAHILPVEEC